MHPLSFLRRHCIANTLPAFRIHYQLHKFIIFFAHLISFPRIHYLFRAFTIFFPILIFLSRIRYRRESSIYIANLLILAQVHYLFRELTLKAPSFPRNRYLFSELLICRAIPLSVSRKKYLYRGI